MKRFMRWPGVCIIAALSIGLGTLAGCRSTDVASPGMGHVAKFTMEFNWPPRTATRPESDAAAPPSLLASNPAKCPPAASTQPLAAPTGGTGPAASQPPYCQPVAAAQGLPPAPVMELASRTAAADPAPDFSPPRFVPEPVSNDPPTVSDATKPVLSTLASAVIPSATARPSNQEIRIPPIPDRNDSPVMQASYKPAADASTKEMPEAEAAPPARQTVAMEPTAPANVQERVPRSPVAADDRSRGTEAAFHVVNSKRVKLHFEVKDAGPSGIAGVELWYIHENRDWKRAEAKPQRQGPYILEVEEEGLYGFKLIARNSQGRGESPPRAGDPPQVWVLVDLTRPAVKIRAARLTQEPDGAKLELAWTVADKNLGRWPVTLLYAEQPEGPWLPLAANLECTGSCQKKLPLTMPKRFLVRVEAIDIAGNLGADQTREFFEMEQAPSRVSILKID